MNYLQFHEIYVYRLIPSGITLERPRGLFFLYLFVHGSDDPDKKSGCQDADHKLQYSIPGGTTTSNYNPLKINDLRGVLNFLLTEALSDFVTFA